MLESAMVLWVSAAAVCALLAASMRAMVAGDPATVDIEPDRRLLRAIALHERASHERLNQPSGPAAR